MKARHYAFLSTFIVALLSLAVIVVAYALRVDPKPKEIGEFEFDGTRTKVFQAGECQVYVTKLKAQDQPMFFYSCVKGR